MGITDNHRETLYAEDSLTGIPFEVKGNSATGAIYSTNVDGPANDVTKRFDMSSSTILYTATAPVGTLDASLGWTITKFDLTDAANSSGKIATDVSWASRASGNYN